MCRTLALHLMLYCLGNGLLISLTVSSKLVSALETLVGKFLPPHSRILANLCSGQPGERSASEIGIFEVGFRMPQ